MRLSLCPNEPGNRPYSPGGGPHARQSGKTRRHLRTQFGRSAFQESQSPTPIVRRNIASFSRRSKSSDGRRLLRFGEIFYGVELAVAVGYADAGGVHVGVEDVGAVLRRLHEALMNGGGGRSLVDVFGNPGEVSAGGSGSGEEIGLAGKLMRDGSLLGHALGMGAGGGGEGFVVL